MKKLLVILVLFSLAIALAGCKKKTAVQAPTTPTNQTTESASQGLKDGNFENIKSAHYVSSNPANNAELDSVPAEVSIKFNFVLAPPSKITISLNQQDVTGGDTKISADKLTLSAPIKSSGAGAYKVEYTACWPDGSCHDGSFGFFIK